MNQQRKFAFGVFLTISVLAIASVALSVYIADLPPSKSPSMGFAKILVITVEGAAIALVAAFMYAITERTKTPTRDTQTSLKEVTTPITEPVAAENNSTKFCSNCGTSLPLDSDFCIECGSKQV